MRGTAAALAVAVAGLLLASCAYDPYTRSYVACCSNNGSINYRYPPAPYGYSAGWSANPPSGMPSAPWAAPWANLGQRFATANLSRDGRLTRQQAAAGMPIVAQQFDDIDIDGKGYVTLPEVRAYASRYPAPGQP